MNRVITALAGGLAIGGVLRVAHAYDVLPWALGFILSCMAVNILCLRYEPAFRLRLVQPLLRPCVFLHEMHRDQGAECRQGGEHLRALAAGLDAGNAERVLRADARQEPLMRDKIESSVSHQGYVYLFMESGAVWQLQIINHDLRRPITKRLIEQDINLRAPGTS